MKSAFLTSVLASALGATPAAIGQRLQPTLAVNDMRVVVHYVSAGELTNLQRRYGSATVDSRDIRQSHRRGFSILRTNRETGARTCEIYLPAQQRPREVDDEGTLSLGHELLHCMHGDYHR
jgi:hypothetical protein